MNKLKKGWIFVFSFGVYLAAQGQPNGTINHSTTQTQTQGQGILLGQNPDNKNITTAVPFLIITPDTRAAGMGDAGVATSPDAASAYWNAGKLAFIDKGYGGSLSYTPWLGKIINDMKIVHLTGFYKIKREEAVAASLKYFDLGKIELRDVSNNSLGRFNAREAAFDVTYSRLLTDNFSAGVSVRYIYSNLTGGVNIGGGTLSTTDATAAHSAAVDFGVYYTKPLKSKNATISWGASISNIGAKVSYSNSGNSDFIPTNLRLGGAYKMDLDPINSLTFVLDFNKLMVPTTALGSRNKPLLNGIFGSFSDASGGWQEELSEITISGGIEYWYNQTFSGRLGYFYEDQTKGNRKHLTAGVGFRFQKFGVDAAYLVPTNQRESPLAETLRFTIQYLIAKKAIVEESVTD
ncbi:MAG: type IX secretion system outer membrane channel protein PorV [Cyclobacteriaceae bacterium]|nr:type IX secretion system outer membrane channel protein PorV [Cyclobacteriaceae bacterium]